MHGCTNKCCLFIYVVVRCLRVRLNVGRFTKMHNYFGNDAIFSAFKLFCVSSFAYLQEMKLFTSKITCCKNCFISVVRKDYAVHSHLV